MRRIIVGLSIVIIVVIGGIWFISTTLIGNAIAAAMVTAAMPAGFDLRFEAPRFFIPRTFEAEQVKLGYPAAFLNLTIDRLAVRAGLLRLLERVPEISFKGTAYDGAIEGLAQFDSTALELRGWLRLADLQLARHPQILALGIEGGRLSFSSSDVIVAKNRLLSGAFALTGSDISMPQAQTIELRQLPLPLRIPALTIATINAKAKAAADRIALETFELDSSCGTVRGSGGWPTYAGGTINAELQINLTESGNDAFGPFLRLIPGPRAGQDARTFVIDIQGRPGRLELRRRS